MVSKIGIVIFQIFLLSLELRPTKSQTWIRAGYFWPEEDEFPVPNIEFSLFTHLICCCADLDSNFYNLSLPPSHENYFSIFTETVKRKNPSITTLLSIGGRDANYSIFSSMINSSSHRKSFINSSITTARQYGFGGLDFYWLRPNTTFDMFNLPILFEDWRVAINSEARISSKSPLILTAVLPPSPEYYSEFPYPIDTVQQYLNWSHVIPKYLDATITNFTAAPSALYDPTDYWNTDHNIEVWIDAGLPANKLVICLPYYGYAWQLVNSTNNGIGAPTIGPAFSEKGFIIYREIKKLTENYGAKIMYNSTYVVNYCTIFGTSWIGFDDVEAIQAKVSYAKKKELLGYFAWKASYDDDWALSQAAAQDDRRGGQNKLPYLFLVVILPIAAAVMLLLGLVIYFRWMRKLKSKEGADSVQESSSQEYNAAAAGDFNSNASTLILYSLAEIEAATDKFSIENKLGEGGYGPVYKGVLQDGQIIAVN